MDSVLKINHVSQHDFDVASVGVILLIAEVWGVLIKQHGFCHKDTERQPVSEISGYLYRGLIVLICVEESMLAA